MARDEPRPRRDRKGAQLGLAELERPQPLGPDRAFVRWQRGGVRGDAPLTARRLALVIRTRERPCHEGARAAATLEVALGEKLPVRFEHRDARDAELPREIARRRHRLAAPELARQDAGAERGVDLAVEGRGTATIEREQSGHTDSVTSGD